MCEPIDGVIDDVFEVVLHLFHLCFGVGNVFVGFFDVEFRYFAYRFFAQFHHIVARYRFVQQITIRIESAFDGCQLVVPRWEILFQNFVDAFLEE